MPQMKRSLALIYAVNPFGADHMSIEHDLSFTKGAYYTSKERFEALGLTEPLQAQSLGADKVEFARRTQHIFSMMDSLNMCQFAWGPSWQLYGPEHMVKMTQAVTGWDVNMDKLLAVGERRLNMITRYADTTGIGLRTSLNYKIGAYLISYQFVY